MKGAMRGCNYPEWALNRKKKDRKKEEEQIYRDKVVVRIIYVSPPWLESIPLRYTFWPGNPGQKIYLKKRGILSGQGGILSGQGGIVSGQGGIHSGQSQSQRSKSI